ncbi:sporulation histidine kinase inhibitor Sda [Paenibacillus validus]|uniref:sporulation histidine kinase inhibitor Sda n=1 Tax=Paenibacillus validus TaxID=44253 RepID=UPI003D29A272
MSSLKFLNNDLLSESYQLTFHLGLEQEFLNILQRELRLRGIWEYEIERSDNLNAETTNEA